MFRPRSQADLAPFGLRERAEANLAAVEVLQRLQGQGRAASAEEQAVLARWGSWGAVPAIFDENRPEWATQRQRLKTLLDEREYAAANRTVLNAHYTDPQYVEEMWLALVRLGFESGRVLEPGCGSGTFLGMAPPGADTVGVELDPISAGIAAALYPGAQVRAESFADTKLPRGYFDAAIGNVPFAKLTLHDPAFNAGNHSTGRHGVSELRECAGPKARAAREAGVGALPDQADRARDGGRHRLLPQRLVPDLQPRRHRHRHRRRAPRPDHCTPRHTGYWCRAPQPGLRRLRNGADVNTIDTPTARKPARHLAARPVTAGRGP